jgi:hypothetical protein
MMSKRVEVFLTILCEEATKREQKFLACTHIQEKLAELEIPKAQLTVDSNLADVTAVIECEESELPAKLAAIRAISGVKSASARILVPI